MLKQVSLVLAFLALAAAAPQFPYYHPFPLYSPYMTVPVMRSPLSPYPHQYMPYPLVSPYSYTSHVPSHVQPSQPAQPAQAFPGTRIGGEVQKPVDNFSDDFYDDKNISLQLAEKLLTPQQLRQLEETVAAMNPLEYAARLEVTKDPEEAIRLFKKSRY